MFEKFDLTEAVNIYNPCDYDPSLPFKDLEFILTEDMFYVTYNLEGEKYSVDVGWYPEGDKNGKYTIYLIKNDNWDKPLKKRRTKNYKRLEKYMKKFLEHINKIKASTNKE